MLSIKEYGILKINVRVFIFSNIDYFVLLFWLLVLNIILKKVVGIFCLKYKYVTILFFIMERVKELINIAEHKTDLSEEYDEGEWDEIMKLNDETRNEYLSKLSDGAFVRFVLANEREFHKIVAEEYKNNKINFITLKQEIDAFCKHMENIENYSSPKTEKEKKYGYSWAFLHTCNRFLGISLRKLEKETGILISSRSRENWKLKNKN